VVCGSPLFGAGHADVLSSSMEDVVEEEVIASGSAAGGGGGIGTETSLSAVSARCPPPHQ